MLKYSVLDFSTCPSYEMKCLVRSTPCTDAAISHRRLEPAHRIAVNAVPNTASWSLCLSPSIGPSYSVLPPKPPSSLRSVLECLIQAVTGYKGTCIFIDSASTRTCSDNPELFHIRVRLVLGQLIRTDQGLYSGSVQASLREED